MRKIICYDLHGANPEDYNELYVHLTDNYGAIRATESVFVFFSNLKNKEIADDLYGVCDGKNISLIVADLPGGVYTYNIEDTEKWFNK